MKSSRITNNSKPIASVLLLAVLAGAGILQLSGYISAGIAVLLQQIVLAAPQDEISDRMWLYRSLEYQLPLFALTIGAGALLGRLAPELWFAVPMLLLPYLAETLFMGYLLNKSLTSLFDAFTTQETLLLFLIIFAAIIGFIFGKPKLPTETAA